MSTICKKQDTKKIYLLKKTEKYCITMGSDHGKQKKLRFI